MARGRNAKVALAILVLGAGVVGIGGVGVMGASEHGQVRMVHGGPAGYLVQALPTPVPTPIPARPTITPTPTQTPGDYLPSGDGW